ncbi:MAG: polyketide synthase dehydratase domain-containing protein, partial [Nitrospirae bacterium]|nr:polyketide synthase dehydratase domain-containing protein [Nitrospirota bacterium]
RIYEYAVVPGTVYIEMALAAGKYLTRSETITLSNFKIFHPLTISENERGTKIQTLIMPENDNSGFTFKIFSRLETIDDGLPWLLHAGGTISAVSTTTAENPEALASVQSRCAQELEVSDIYRQFASRGLQYGPDFRAIQKLWTGDGEALGLIILSASVDSSTYNTHPIAIDAALQTAFALISHTTTENFLPVGIGTLTARLQPVTKLWSHARTISTTDNEMKLDFTVYRDDGTPVMFMEGLTAKKADRTKLIRKSEARLDDFLYEIYWERRDSEAAHQTADLPVQSGQWVVFSDRDALGMELASHFRENGLECVIVGPGAAYRELPGGEGCEVNPQSAGDFEKLFSAFGRLSGVVYLWGAAVTNPDGGLSYIKEQQDIGVIGLLHTVQVLVKHGRATRLMAATRGVWPVGQDRVNNVRPWQAPVWGFGRVLFIEHPELDSILVDLAAIPGQSEGLFLYNELFHGGRQRQTALRDGKRYCCRLKRRGLSAAPVPEAENTALRLSEYGTMDALSLKPADRVSPSGNEVEIEVKAAGLNFRDVLNALGMLREFSRGKTAQEVAFGFECSGVVSRIGSEVKDIRPGDPVIAAPVSGTFSAYTTVDSDFVSPMPENMSYNESATLPLAYLTAWYGVIVLCRLRAGDSVLIHAAAGGVGLAALNLAKMVNATIYATASRGKWDFLRAQGVKHIMDSR